MQRIPLSKIKKKKCRHKGARTEKEMKAVGTEGSL